MIRLFIAVPVPEEIRFILHSMGRSIHGAKGVPQEQIHLTLRFIGEVDGTLFHDIAEQLATISSSRFTMKIEGVGHFPPRGKPRVVWAGIEDNSHLGSLKRKVDTALLHCGLPPDKRKFAPHITLARLNTSSLQRITEFLSGNAFLEFPSFEVNSFQLYSSRLGHKGAVHTLEQSYNLVD